MSPRHVKRPVSSSSSSASFDSSPLKRLDLEMSHTAGTVCDKKITEQASRVLSRRKAKHYSAAVDYLINNRVLRLVVFFEREDSVEMLLSDTPSVALCT